MGMTVDTEGLQVAIERMLAEYGDTVYKATEEGLTAAEKILIKAQKAASPSSEGGGDYKKGWKGKGKKYKMHRYVGNAKMVKGKDGDIPLSNILEYSSNSKYQGLIKQTYENNVNAMAQAVVDKIKGV